MKISALSLAVVAALVPSIAVAKNATISVVTNNVYFMSEILYPNWGQSKMNTTQVGSNGL
jgi:phospholipase C/sphingomyelin phosphodiesterase